VCEQSVREGMPEHRDADVLGTQPCGHTAARRGGEHTELREAVAPDHAVSSAAFCADTTLVY
jgi:hypothetical protein